MSWALETDLVSSITFQANDLKLHALLQYGLGAIADDT